MIKRHVTLTLKLPTARCFHSYLRNSFSPNPAQEVALTKVRAKLGDQLARAAALNAQPAQPHPQITKSV